MPEAMLPFSAGSDAAADSSDTDGGCRLILASGSPRRRTLLSELGVPFSVIVSDVAETADPELNPPEQAIALAEQKARAVAAKLAEGLVLGADTIVVLDGEILGKPVDDEDARRMLRRLAGRPHRVITGIALVDAATGAVSRSVVTSVVHVRPLSDEEVAAYVATGEPRDKAGAYAIQGIGAGLIAGLDGCYTNVVGLPLCETAGLLAAAGVHLPASWQGCRLLDGTSCPREV
jgi:septum formation protein